MSSSPPKSFLNRSLEALRGSPFQRGQRAASKGDLTKAAAIWNEGAREGDADCQLALAACLWQGVGVLTDIRSAFRWYEKAAAQGKADAQARLASAYATGIGRPPGDGKPAPGEEARLWVPRDTAKARHWASLAAEQGHVEAQVLLGWLYSMTDGDLDDRNINLAIEWYSRAAEKGSAPAMVGLAGLISVGDVPGQGAEDAFKLYCQAAELGNKTAYYYVGIGYMQGNGVTPDPALARKWLQRAAGEGLSGAMRALGHAYRFGINGIPLDLSKAETWFRRGAVKGDTDSMYMLAELHANGRSTVPNLAEAVFWFSAAAELGHAKAMTALGMCHLSGKGINLDVNRANELFTNAADRHVEAQFQLALSHLLGRGLPENPARAAELMLEAAERGHADAAYNYGSLLINGRGVPANAQAAFQFYARAAEMGSASGQYRIAAALAGGKELPLDRQRAIDLFAAAAEQGHVSALINVARMIVNYRPEDVSGLAKWREMLQPHADAGVREAITILAELHWRVDADADTALALLAKAEALGDPLVSYVRSMIRPTPIVELG